MPEEEINFKEIERKWQSKWEESKIFEVSKNDKKNKFYVLEMFPYPSASGLHMGHALNFTIGDIFSRFKIMKGFNVLHPMGFDALGLPAENAAIKAGEHPKPFTQAAMKNYIRQMKEIGLSYDWSRSLATMDPEYYKWDQWIFLKMLERGLAYKKKSSVNWCPECKSVLANEQVVNGKCWRHDDTDVEVKHLNQWYLKITQYADELYEEIDKLQEWPETIKKLQKNWINKSYGSEITFDINGFPWKIFTTRPDTLMGVTFMVVSAQHSKLMDLVTDDRKAEVDAFLKKLKSVSEKELEDMEKEGVFTGSYAKHPITGEKIPVWAGNFVLADYGSGMVMAVPAHDQRDFEFAKKYNIPIKLVISPEGKEIKSDELEEAYTGEGVLINSKDFDGLKWTEAKQHITNALKEHGKGDFVVNFKLRDWLISRQRYWGTPIPVVYCDECGVVPVDEKDLPVELPEDVKFGEGNPLLTNGDWINTKCPKCGGDARRETDTMDTFVNSSWYYLRYCDNKNDEEIFDREKANYWCPIDLYIGGREHACMHLIYIRFYTKFLRDIGLLNFDEPAIKLFNQGMLHGPDGDKMSKSKGNVVLPENVSEKYGMDSARLFLVSIASPDKDIDWSESGIEGSVRFVKRLMDYVKNVKIGKSSAKVEHMVNKAIRGISSDIENLRYNFAVIKIRELFDSLEEEISKKDLEKCIKLISPFCPHIAEELWETAGNGGFVSIEDWPELDENKINEDIDKMEESLNKTVEDVRNILKIMKEKNGVEGEKVYLYVIPNELDSYDGEAISEKLDKKVKVFAVNDKKKYDPEGKAGKAKPGKPGIFIE